jgi:hypothetical protein
MGYCVLLRYYMQCFAMDQMLQIAYFRDMSEIWCRQRRWRLSLWGMQ